MSSDATWQYYRYDPSLAGAIIFIMLFIITTALHLYQLISTRTWCFIPFAVGGFFEWIGYIGRALGHKETPNWTLGPYILQNILLLLAPALFAASIYMVLGRIIRITGGQAHSLIRCNWLTKVFVIGDVVSFLTQASGGGIMASGSVSSMKLGERIVIGGLCIQIAFFGFFMVTAATFDLRLRRSPTPQSECTKTPWRKHLGVLYFASVLIMVRSLFRVIEYVQGNSGYIMKHEAFLYIFDALLMFCLMAVFNVIHPSKVVSHKQSEWDEHDLVGR